jgi:hypothetical protein
MTVDTKTDSKSKGRNVSESRMLVKGVELGW